MNSNFLNYKNSILQREELKQVFGGFGSCVAACNDGSTVLCQGSNCSAEDGVGCSSETGSTNCPSAPSNT